MIESEVSKTQRADYRPYFSRMKRELGRYRLKTMVLKQSFELLEDLTKENSQWLVVIDPITNEWLFYNYPVRKALILKEFIPQLKQWLNENLSRATNYDTMENVELELSNCKCTQFFSVIRRPVVWHGRSAVVFMFTDESKKNERIKKLEIAANYDALTKLYNRNYGMCLLHKWIDEKKLFVLCFVDIDNLKYVNDKFGHLEGDCYIQRVSAVMKMLSQDVIICRVGGDEFMLLAKGWTEKETEEQLETLRMRLIKKGEVSGCPHYNSLSFGIVQVDPDNTLPAGELLSIADKRMYEYKQRHKMGKKVSIVL